MNISKNYLKLTNLEYKIMRNIIDRRHISDINQVSLEELYEIYRMKEFTGTKLSTSYINELFPHNILDIYNNTFNSDIGKSIVRHTEKSRTDIKFLEYFFLFAAPLTRLIYQLHSKNKQPLIFGFQAPQSCGKTTVCNIIEKLSFEYFNLTVRSISSDDLYYPYEKLEEIKANDPRFKFRGPPGTHDIPKGIRVLQNVKEAKTDYYLPSYSKNLRNGLGDVMPDSSKNYIKNPIDVLIFEGWFNGIRPVSDEILISQCNNDNKLDFQLKVRNNLNDYQCLWEMFDSMLILTPERYELSREWRIRTERDSGKMSDSEINQFVDYFWDAMPPRVYFSNLLDSVKNNQKYILLGIDERMDYYTMKDNLI